MPQQLKIITDKKISIVTQAKLRTCTEAGLFQWFKIYVIYTMLCNIYCSDNFYMFDLDHVDDTVINLKALE